ncbi:MAG: hypothetical protein PHT54_00330 [Candidatus Nanoarchaeia archaeon]|nr:hypothetical protein [Candidatus Nanoarchaeia archaeon]
MEKKISNKTLAIILVVLIIISAAGTLMAIKNKDNVKTFDSIETPTGKIGVSVNEINKTKEKNERTIQ